MKWCEDCKCEFEDYVEICSDCGKALIQYEEELEEKMEYEYEDYVFLTKCSTNNEANLLLSLLESHGIIADLRYEGSGSYLNIVYGVNYQGVDVLVIPKNLDEAKNILNEFEYSYINPSDEYESKALKKYKRNKKIIAYFIILSLIGNLLIFKLFELFRF